MKRFKRILLITLALVILAITGGIVFSPYGNHDGFDYKLVEHTVEIDAPADSVFKYLGNSDNARHWSVFVDHITPLNADSFPDGMPGGRRRCFSNPEETGLQWDELITIVEPGKRRQLVCYDLKDFPMAAKNLATEQLYAPLGPWKCRLTFTLFFYEGKSTWWDELKTYFGAYRVKSIYEQNMANIERLTEERYAQKK